MPTIIDVCETWTESAGWTHTGEPGGGSSTAKRQFTVTHTGDATSVHVLADNRIPQFGAPHPANQFFRCRGVDAKKTGPISSEVEAKYEFSVALGDGEGEPNPLNEPPIIRISTVKTDGQVQEDINGMPLVNTVMEPFQNLQKPYSDMAISITKNIALFNFNNIDLFADTVNSAMFLGFPAGVLRIESIEAENVVDGDFQYWTATVVIQSRRPVRTTPDKAWWLRVRNEGYREKIIIPVLSVPVIINAVDENLDKVSSPILLKEDGTRALTPEDTYWLEFQIFETVDFNNLGLI